MTFPDIPTGAAGRQVTGVQANTTATRTFPNLSGLTKNAGDLLIAIVAGYQTTAAAGSIWSGWSAGWTEFVDVGGSSNTAIGAAYKWSDGTETGTISVTQAGTITGHAAFVLLSISTAHATTPPEGGAIANGTTTAVAATSLDPAGWGTEDTLWISVAVGGETSTTGSFTGLGASNASYSNTGITAISSDVVGGLNLGVAFRQLNAASEAAPAWTVDTSNARNSHMMIAVRGGIPTHQGAVAMTAPSTMAVGGIKETSGSVAMTAPSTLTSDATIPGAGSPATWVATATFPNTSVQDIVITKPGTVQADDVMVLHIARWSSGTLAGPSVLPSGASSIGNSNIAAPANGGNIRSDVIVKRVAAESSWTTTYAAAEWSNATALFFRGVPNTLDLTTLAIQFATATSATTTMPAPTITATSRAALAYFVNGADTGAAWTGTPPTGFTERRENDFDYAASKDDVTAGSTTISGGVNSTSQVMIAAAVNLPGVSGPTTYQGAVAMTAPSTMSVAATAFRPITYSETSWTTEGTQGTNVDYKDITVSVQDGDLVVLAGFSTNASGTGTAAIATQSGTTDTWTIGRSNNTNGTPGAVWGHTVARATGNITIRGTVPTSSGTVYMGLGVWVIPSSMWTGTPVYTAVEFNQNDATASVTLSGLSTVIFAGADWSAGDPGSSITPADGVIDTTTVLASQYGIFTAHWTDRTAGTTSYGASAPGGALDWIDVAVTIPQPTAPTYQGAVAMTAPSTLSVSAISYNPNLPWPTTVSGRRILDQNSNPYFVSMYHQWNLIGWGGGRNETGVGTTTPHSAFDAVGSALQANGINTILVLSITSNQGGETGPNQNGNTWDGVAPWSGGTPGNLNETYWARVDDLIDTMAGYGITVYLFLISSYTIATGTAYASMTAGQATTFGSNLAARYKDRQNIIWGFGADYFDSVPTQIQNICTALRAGGDTHLISLEFMAESGTYIKSEGDAAGTVPTQVDFADVYSYNAAALEVRRAYGATTKPVVFANGHYYQGGTADEKVMSDLLGWAFTSGSTGFFVGSEGTWQNNTGYLTAINNDAWPNTNYPAVRTALIGLTEWSNLVPASGATFVTSSRGTDATAIASGGSGGQYDAADPQNNYLTCAVTADGKLGVVYTPTARTGITVDTSKLVATYDVFWVDPHNGSTSSTSVAGSYNTPGNNSAGNGGWYLVFQASTTKQGASAMTASSTLTVAAFLAEFGTVVMTAPSTLTSAAVRTTAGAVAMTAASILAASGVREQPATVAMTAPSALATTGVRTTAGSVTMTASSTLTVAAVRTTDAIVAMSAPSTLVSAAFLTLPAVAAMTAPSTLTVAGVRSTDGTVVMTAPSVLVSAATSSGSGGVAMTAPSVFVAGAFKTTAGATNMTAPSALTVAGVRTTSGTVAMTAQSALVVAAFRGLIAAATMTAPSTLTAASIVSQAAVVAMTAASTLIAAASTGAGSTSPFKLWNGVAELPMTMKYWNGTTELPLASYSIAP